MPSDPLYPVRLHDVSADARALLKELLREVLTEHLGKPRAPAGALRGKEAARYIGLGKTRFYKVIKEDPVLKAASFKIGNARAWPVTALDAWMAAQVAQPKLLEAA
jgi:predicted DNA-binding transcriptional regulator AlpA